MKFYTQYTLISLVIFLSSCKKAPSNGEAFITLKSNEIRFLADQEILFFDEDFAEEFNAFRNTLITETRNKKLFQLDESIRSSISEKQAIEQTKNGMISKAVEDAKISMKEGWTKLNSSFEELRHEISKTDTLVASLEKDFLEYQKKECDIALKIQDIQKSADERGYNLIKKINQTIIDEKIPIEIYNIEEKSSDIIPRSINQMVNDAYDTYPINLYKHIPSKLSGISGWLRCDTDMRFAAKRSDHFTLSIVEENSLGDDYDTLIFTRNLSGKLESSKIASEICKYLTILNNSSKEIESLYSQAVENNDAFTRDLKIWVNTSNITLKSLNKKLSERLILEAQLKKFEADYGNLLSIKEGSDIWNKKINEVEDAAEKDYERKLEEINDSIESDEGLKKRIKSDKAFIDLEHLSPNIGRLVAEALDSMQLSKIRTGSDGKFSVPPKARYVSTFLKREASEEEVFWLIKINMDDTSVKITNSNVTKTTNITGSSAYIGAIHAELD